MKNLQLDWGTAEVSGGELTVSLDERPTDEWAATFKRTAQLLDNGTWPDIKLKKRGITVKKVGPGSEERLRFFLESVIQEANSEHGSEEGEEREEAQEEPAEKRDERDPDRAMTDAFRSFATGAPEDAEA